ncbi:MAG: sensor histidine kinase [Rhizobiaceae bacterium]|nr:sensor histidine kinase [Rhizobiaceae bacterium]
MVWAALLFAGVALFIAAYGNSFATGIYLDQASARGAATLRLATAALRGHLNRYEALPQLIADHADIKMLVENPHDERLRDWANDYLKEVNALLESSDIYVMMPNGDTIVASNHDGPASFVGENFNYRPYFQEAMAGGPGRFFALGTTSLKRGYYFSAPILVEGGIRGVVVFKVDIDAIEKSWTASDHEIIVTDPEGIIFMSGRAEWRYAALQPLTPDRLARTAASRRYAIATLRELPVERGAFGDRHELMTISGAGQAKEYLALAESMPEAGWTVTVLLDTASAHAQALTSVAAVLLLMGLAALALAVLVQRRARLRERMDMQRQSQQQLEHRVEERTAELADANRQLAEEVAERRATEARLRKTQADLLQAGKLAALGQMSAALSHEFNQPLSAVKAYADNAAILIESNRTEEARDNVSRISGLIDRMASISRHLRNFARKPNQKLGPVLVTDVIADALEIVGWRLKAADATVTVDIDPQNLTVHAGSVRLQQVLVNLISNAVDATEGGCERTIEIVGRGTGRKVSIAVRDRGPGVPDAIRQRIFDPFFTTRGVGKGLGLGLSISYNIIKDFGGDLHVNDRTGSGAEFLIELRAAEMPALEVAE